MHPHVPHIPNGNLLKGAVAATGVPLLMDPAFRNLVLAQTQEVSKDGHERGVFGNGLR